MKKSDVQKLKHGLYRIFWKESAGGGTSLAAVGSFANGDRWLAPTNWISIEDHYSKYWKVVKKVELIKGNGGKDENRKTV